MVERMMRWVVQLECSHNLLDDDIPDLETAEYCPGCALYVRVTGCYSYRDDEVDVHLDPEFYEESTGQGRR